MRASLKVFVCSTYSDLNEEREGVMEAIKRLQHQHDSMEYFGARPDQPIRTCLKEVRRSDVSVVIVIVGHRYGSMIPEMDVSFTEAEYAEGFRLGKPCLVYIRDEEVPIRKCFDADSGKDLATEVREYYIPDFSNWKDHDAFETAFDRLLRDLKAEEK